MVGYLCPAFISFKDLDSPCMCCMTRIASYIWKSNSSEGSTKEHPFRNVKDNTSTSVMPSDSRGLGFWVSTLQFANIDPCGQIAVINAFSNIPFLFFRPNKMQERNFLTQQSFEDSLPRHRLRQALGTLAMMSSCALMTVILWLWTINLSLILHLDCQKIPA